MLSTADGRAGGFAGDAGFTTVSSMIRASGSEVGCDAAVARCGEEALDTPACALPTSRLWRAGETPACAEASAGSSAGSSAGVADLLDASAGTFVEVSSAMLVSSALTRFQPLACGPLRISGFDGKIIPPFFIDFFENDRYHLSELDGVPDFVDAEGCYL